MANPLRKKKKNDTDQFVKGTLSGYIHDLLIVILVVLILFLLIFRVVVVSGPSMNNTLYHNDFLILLNNIFYKDPQYGDIIVASKDSFDDGKPFIKRVIAVEGQEVDIDFDAGIVYVDGKALDEPYTLTPTTLREGMDFPLVVDENCVFVMGDNRGRSKDSRSLEIGLVDKRQILGKAIFLVFPGKDPVFDARDFTRIGVVN